MAVRYHIIKAGAGAGKTRRLVLKFLDILLRLYKKNKEFPLNSILAITFTNAAADEMRDRVIKILKKLSIPEMEMEIEIDEEFKRLLKIYGLEASDISSILDYIIHHYSDLEIKTIDSFVHSLILSIPFFAEVFLTPEMEISNSDFYIEYACDLLIKKYGTDLKMREIIKNFVEEILEEKKGREKISWDIKNELSRKTKELRSYETNLGEEIDFDFYFQSDSQIEEFKEKYNIKDIKDAFKKKKGKAEKNFSENVLKEGSEAISLRKYAPYVNVYKHLKAEIKTLKEKRRVVFIDELNMIAKNIIKNVKDSPIIFEKLGGRIFYFLIDEFQDTSRIQWENLLPLIEEALANGGELFCVGDSKQAIYGFRGGDPELFEGLFSQSPFLCVGEEEIKCEKIEENYRSVKEIIEFNNEIFNPENLSSWLDIQKINEKGGKEAKPKILRVYTHSSQKVVRKSEEGRGFLFVEMIEKEGNEEDFFCEKIFERLNDFRVFERFSKSDICFLLRKTKDVQKWTHFLLSKDIPVESTLTMDIRENFLLREIVEILRFFDTPYNNFSFASFITGKLFEKVSKIPGENFYKWIEEWKKNKGAEEFLYERFREDYRELWERYFSHLFRAAGYLPLYDFVIMVLNKFEVYESFPEHIAFLKHFEDLISSLEGKGISTIGEFLKKWDKESEEAEGEFTLRLPLQTDAVKVMTIHKAKGLQFPVVVLPEISLTHKDNIFNGTFIPYKDEKGLRFYYSIQDIRKHSEKLERIYKEHVAKGLLEEINCLYVAMTRAMDELYIFLPKKKIENFYTSLILHDKSQIKKGTPVKRKVSRMERKEEIPSLPPRKNWDLKFVREIRRGEEVIDEKRRKAMLTGEGIHLLLSTIKGINSAEELEKALKENFKIIKTNPELAEVEEELSEVLNPIINFLKKEPLRFFLLPSERVFTEKEVLGTDGKVRRIDRLIVFDDRVEVIEFKWGEKREKEHRIQLEDYISLISQIFQDKPVKGFLIYLDAEKVEEVS
jgi:ATP-dependent exoDNAse (exonuclease V) beta subunit